MSSKWMVLYNDQPSNGPYPSMKVAIAEANKKFWGITKRFDKNHLVRWAWMNKVEVRSSDG